MRQNDLMVVSNKCLSLIKGFESFRPFTYLCQAGIKTIGYGHTLNVKAGDACSQYQADIWLREDIKEAEEVIRSEVMIKLTQGQYDALVSFVFNVGPGVKGVKDGFARLKTGQPSTMLRKINLNLLDDAAHEFEKWNLVNGAVSSGIVKRRVAEKALFLS